ncbi:hypothetical protein [Capnocytophaga canis]|uniref:Lipoprotein n=1 Tax=Capnocytophaga canis TaxID=1848903 RepID=A0A0B7IJZ4_9FLAO|nr:hypothetical protein [Capnocytophaga canis]GIM61011.1 hypothetical protein CAPN008_10610 [Capnocytophaga canis]CEN50293.1 hypothetical protein CCAND93_110019 [Capnocytophaga canis]
MKKSKLYIFLVLIGFVACKKDSSLEEKKKRCSLPPVTFELIIQENENLPTYFSEVYNNVGKDISIFLLKDSLLVKDIVDVALYKGNIAVFASDYSTKKYVYTEKEVRFLIKQAERVDTLKIKGARVQKKCGFLGRLDEIYFNDVKLDFHEQRSYIVAFPKKDAI